MQLSKYGCMPKLIDFLRVNEDNELLEIIGMYIIILHVYVVIFCWSCHTLRSFPSDCLGLAFSGCSFSMLSLKVQV